MNTTEKTDSKDFRQLVQLLHLYSNASASLDAIEAQAAKEYLAVIERHQADYARLQGILTGTEKVAEDLCRSHPEWFTEKKGLKTPFGTAKLTRTTKLETDDEQKAIALMWRKHARNKEFPLGNFVREEQRIDREAMEKLSDAELAEFRIVRVVEQSFSIAPLKVKMEKAVKEAAESKEVA